MSSLEQEVASFFERLSSEDARHKILEASHAYKHWFRDYKQGLGNLDKHLAGMTRYGLSELEATLVLSYTARTSSWANAHNHYSLANDTDKFRYEHNLLLTKILNKLPGYNCKTVFRMDFNSPASYNQKNFYSWISKRIGQVIHVPYFWSTSKERWDDDCLTWKIQTSITSKARDISDLTQSPSEQEVLFISGTNFQITAVDKKNKLVSLDEVDIEQYNVPLIGLYYKNY